MVHVRATFFSVLLVLAVFGFDRGLCIKCYSCSSRINEGCLKPYRYDMPLKHCGLPVLNETKAYAEEVDSSFSKLFQVDIHTLDPLVPLNCLKQVTKVGTKEVVIRGCQLAASDNLDICVKVKTIGKDNIRTTYCTLCNADGCNSALVTSPLPLFLAALLYSHLLCC